MWMLPLSASIRIAEGKAKIPLAGVAYITKTDESLGKN